MFEPFAVFLDGIHKRLNPSLCNLKNDIKQIAKNMNVIKFWQISVLFLLDSYVYKQKWCTRLKVKMNFI